MTQGNTFTDLMDKINTLHQINGGRVGDLPGEPRNVLLIDGDGGTPLLTLLTSIVTVKTGGLETMA